MEALVPGGMEAVVRALFPGAGERAMPGPWATPPSEQEMFSPEEVMAAADALPGRKAVGPGGNPNEAIKAAIRDDPARFTAIANSCLRGQYQPCIIKRGWS